MARRRLNRRITQRIFIAHRGGGASSAGAVGADFAGFFAAVPGGKADIGFTVVNDVMSAMGTRLSSATLITVCWGCQIVLTVTASRGLQSCPG